MTPSQKQITGLVVAILTLVQCSALLVGPLFVGEQVAIEHHHAEVYRTCIEYWGEGNKAFCQQQSLEWDGFVRWPLVALLLLVCNIPASGLLVYGIKALNDVSRKESTPIWGSLLCGLLGVFLSGAILFTGFSILWTFGLRACPPPTLVNIAGRIVGFPILLSIGVFSEAAARTVACSGKNPLSDVLKDRNPL